MVSPKASYKQEFVTQFATLQRKVETLERSFLFKKIPIEIGRSEPMVAGKVTISAPGVTEKGPIQITSEGAATTGCTVSERKIGESFVVTSGGTNTNRINWAVYPEQT